MSESVGGIHYDVGLETTKLLRDQRDVVGFQPLSGTIKAVIRPLGCVADNLATLESRQGKRDAAWLVVGSREVAHGDCYLMIEFHIMLSGLLLCC